MLKNSIKADLLAQRNTVGCWLTLASPGVAEVLAHCGFDWLVIDMEHAPNDPLSVTEQLRAIAAASNLAAPGSRRPVPAVRITSSDPELVKRAMDAGCSTVIFPNVNSGEEAALAVQSMRFPDGDNGGLRGVAGLVRAGTYGLDPDFVREANDEACTIVQIESAEALARVDEIAAVDGVDCLFIGTADLSASLGHLGDPGHPDVQAALRIIAEAGQRSGKAVGAFSVGPEDAAFYRRLGASFVALHSDVAWLARGAMDARTALDGIDSLPALP